MNLKLAKKIRQGLREMAQTTIGGAIRGRWPEDYEGDIPRHGSDRLAAVFHHDYIHSTQGELWQTKSVDSGGKEVLVPTRVVVRLRLIAARQIYKRAKRAVSK